MKTAYFKGPRNVELRDSEIPEPGEGQVLVRIKACGVCAFDVHCYNKQDKEWHTQGHEAGGTVEKVGQEVQGLKAGDKVAIIMSIPCYSCENCLKGKHYYCLSSKGPGCICFSEYILVDSKYIFPVADLTCEDAAILEPLSVSMNLVHCAEVGSGDRVLLLGAGPIGLMTIPYCRKLGADRIYISELSVASARIELAKKWGADEILCPDKENIVDKLLEAEPTGIDRILITAKPSIVLKDAINVAAKGAVISYVGLEGKPETSLTIPVDRLHFKKMKLVGADPNPCGLFYSKAAKLIDDSIIDTNSLVSHRFKLEDIQEAFKMAQDRKGKGIKVMVTA